MKKKQRKSVKNQTARNRAHAPESVPKATFAPDAVQKFVDDLRIRGESGPLVKGKLAKGRTHIELKKGSTVELKRARFNLA